MKDDTKAIGLLKDAMTLLEDIKRARELPDYGLPHLMRLAADIRTFLQDEGALQRRD